MLNLLKQCLIIVSIYLVNIYLFIYFCINASRKLEQSIRFTDWKWEELFQKLLLRPFQNTIIIFPTDSFVMLALGSLNPICLLGFRCVVVNPFYKRYQIITQNFSLLCLNITLTRCCLCRLQMQSFSGIHFRLKYLSRYQVNFRLR